MISMALSTVGLLGLLGLQIISVRGNMMSRNFAEAIGIAQQQLELVDATAYTSSVDAQPIRRARSRAAAISPSRHRRHAERQPDPGRDVAAGHLSSLHDGRRRTRDNTTTVQVTVYWIDTSTNLHQVDALDAEEPVRNARLHAHRAHDLDGALRPHRRRRDVAGHGRARARRRTRRASTWRRARCAPASTSSRAT